MNKGSSIRRRSAMGFVLLCLSLLIGLAAAEGIIRIFSFDWRYIKKAVPIMDNELPTHISDPDPRIIISLRPNSVGHYQQLSGPFTVSVNSLGHRGPERQIAKPPGVFRILCVGGSNVYGAGINDHETWPAQLETELNAAASGKFEVWNLGVSGYNGLQMAAVAERAVKLYSPDLLIYALSNIGPRFFLRGAPNIEKYFHEDPTLWLELLPEKFFRSSRWMPEDAKLWLLRHVGLYRYVTVVRFVTQRPRWFGVMPYLSPHYIKTCRDFLEKARRQLPVAVYICPAVQPPTTFEPYYSGINVPVFVLNAGTLPKEYRDFHPPAYVLQWYAKNIALWLKDNHLIP